MQQYIGIDKYIKNKKMPFAHSFYNPHLNQPVLFADGAAYFYDTDYNLLFKESALKATEEVHFVDEDLCLFTFTSSNKVAFYSIKRREIVDRITFRLPKDIGTLVFCNKSLFCKNKNLIIFWALYQDIRKNNGGSNGIFSFDINTKKYSRLYDNDIHECFGYKDKFYFANIYSQNDNFFLEFNEELKFEKIKIDECLKEMTKCKERGLDPTNGLIIYHDKGDAFDGYTYYGKGTDCICIALDGSIQPWEPPRRFTATDKKDKLPKAETTSNDIPISKRGLIKEDFEDESEEDLLSEGYFWALDSLEKKAKEAKLSVKDYIISGQASDEESILYSVGWFQTELTEGGIDQYFSNSDDKEIQCFSESTNSSWLYGNGENYPKRSGSRSVSKRTIR